MHEQRLTDYFADPKVDPANLVKVTQPVNTQINNETVTKMFLTTYLGSGRQKY